MKCVDEARKLSECLRATVGFRPGNVTSLLNPTAKQLYDALTQLSTSLEVHTDRGEESFAVVSFNGHGLLGKGDAQYLICSDFTSEVALEIALDQYSCKLCEVVGACKLAKAAVILVDACRFSGTNEALDEPAFKYHNAVILYACTAGKTAQGKNSYTQHLMKVRGDVIPFIFPLPLVMNFTNRVNADQLHVWSSENRIRRKRDPLNNNPSLSCGMHSAMLPTLL